MSRRPQGRGSRRPPTPVAEAADPGPPDPDPSALQIGPALRALAVVGPPLTIATSLLFYFGWATTAAQSEAMGLDESIFAMRTQDYVLRSLDALYVPVIALALMTLVWVILHAHVIGAMTARGGGASSPLVRTARQAWWLWLSAGTVVFLVWRPGRELVVPLVLAIALLLVEYRWRLGRSSGRRPGQAATPRWLTTLRAVLVGVIVTVLLFWEVSLFSEVVGRGRAGLMVDEVEELTSVSVLSERDLHLDTHGVTAAEMGGERSAYRFRYDGLRLLQFTGDTWFLVPAGWSPGTAPLIALPTQPGVRLEFSGQPR